MKELKDYVTEIPDFPKEGIIFRDITTIMSDPTGLRMAVDGLVDLLKDVDFDLVVGSESRGFIFGAPVAYAMDKGFILVRKKGKLPRETISEKYDLEYGTAELEMHKDAIKPGQKVVIVDDLIATGGTTEAIVKMVERLGGGRQDRLRHRARGPQRKGQTQELRHGFPHHLRGELMRVECDAIRNGWFGDEYGAKGTVFVNGMPGYRRIQDPRRP